MEASKPNSKPWNELTHEEKIKTLEEFRTSKWRNAKAWQDMMPEERKEEMAEFWRISGVVIDALDSNPNWSPDLSEPERASRQEKPEPRDERHA